MELRIARTWDGADAAPGEGVRVVLTVGEAGLRIEVDAPFHGDPPPPGPPGATPGLWDYEVVEVFVLGPDEQYTEVELSPHGHHLVLQLQGVRNPVATGLPLDFTAVIDGARWRGEARLSADRLPPPPHRHNAYAIHGTGSDRRYLAWQPVPGPAPDFHRLAFFV